MDSHQRMQMNVCHIRWSIILEVKLGSLLLTRTRRKTGDFSPDGQRSPCLVQTCEQKTGESENEGRFWRVLFPIFTLNVEWSCDRKCNVKRHREKSVVKKSAWFWSAYIYVLLFPSNLVRLALNIRHKSSVVKKLMDQLTILSCIYYVRSAARISPPRRAIYLIPSAS